MDGLAVPQVRADAVRALRDAREAKARRLRYVPDRKNGRMPGKEAKPKDVAGASGLKWVRVGKTKPEGYRVLYYHALSKQLAEGKCEFTSEERTRLRVPSALRADSVVRSLDNNERDECCGVYFRPADGHFHLFRIHAASRTLDLQRRLR